MPKWSQIEVPMLTSSWVGLHAEIFILWRNLGRKLRIVLIHEWFIYFYLHPWNIWGLIMYVDCLVKSMVGQNIDVAVIWMLQLWLEATNVHFLLLSPILFCFLCMAAVFIIERSGKPKCHLCTLMTFYIGIFKDSRYRCLFFSIKSTFAVQLYCTKLPNPENHLCRYFTVDYIFKYYEFLHLLYPIIFSLFPILLISIKVC